MSDPCMQEETLNDIDKTIHILERGTSTQAGWLKAAASFGAVVVMALGGFNGIILGKLTSIESKLTDYQVVVAEVKKDVEALKSDVLEIKDRHKYLDQKGIIKQVR